MYRGSTLTTNPCGSSRIVIRLGLSNIVASYFPWSEPLSLVVGNLTEALLVFVHVISEITHHLKDEHRWEFHPCNDFLWGQPYLVTHGVLPRLVGKSNHKVNGEFCLGVPDTHPVRVHACGPTLRRSNLGQWLRPWGHCHILKFDRPSTRCREVRRTGPATTSRFRAGATDREHGRQP